MSHTGLTGRAFKASSLMPSLQPNDDQDAAQLEFSEPDSANYGSVDSRSPDVQIGSFETLPPMLPIGSHPLTHSLGRIELSASRQDAIVLNPEASPPLSPRSRTVLVPHGGSAAQAFRDVKGAGVRDGSDVASEDRGNSASPLTNRAGAATHRLVGPDTYLLHLDAGEHRHVEQFEHALASLRRYGNLAVPALIASGGTALYSAFKHIDNGDVALGVWSGLIGLTCIGAGMGLKFSLCGVTRVYETPQPVEQRPVVHDVAEHED